MVLIVIGENSVQKIFSQTFTVMNREIPEPNPYPAFNLK
jgi:hypothetical protein